MISSNSAAFALVISATFASSSVILSDCDEYAKYIGVNPVNNASTIATEMTMICLFIRQSFPFFDADLYYFPGHIARVLECLLFGRARCLEDCQADDYVQYQVGE